MGIYIYIYIYITCEEQPWEYNFYNWVYNFKNTASRVYEYSK